MPRYTPRRRRRLIERPVASAIESPVVSLVERLESRFLLSLSAVGGEFLVNTATLNVQKNPAIAIDGDGEFVVAWESDDGSSSGIYAQRFSSTGAAQGSEFRVNTVTTDTQSSPAVTRDADGDFVVVWESHLQDGNGFGVYAQRYNAAGTAQGGEFSVNTQTFSNQFSPSVAMNSAGDFVVTWTGDFQDGSGWGIYAQRYNAAGVAQGTEFQANTFTPSLQATSAVAMDSSGDFVVAWYSFGQDGNGAGVYAQRYNSAGVAQGTEFRVNTFTTGQQFSPAVAMHMSGDFVVAWQSNHDGDGYGIYAHRYNAAGAVQGAEFKVNTYTTNTQGSPSIAMDSAGAFVVAWQSNGQDVSGYGVYAQAYNAAGAAQGSEFKVNTFTTSAQSVPTIAMDPAGDIVLAWQSSGQDGSDFGVYAQRYNESDPDTEGSIVAGVFVNGERVFPYQVYAAPVSQILLSFSENMSDTGGSGGANSVTNPANWLVTRDGIDITSGVSITYGFNFSGNRYEAVLNLPASYNSGNFLLMAKANIRDIAGNQLDGNFDGTPGGNYSVPFSIIGFGARGPEFKVNTYITSGQASPSVATDSAGNFVMVWQSNGQDGSGDGIYAKLYNSAGVEQGAEFKVNTYTTSLQRNPAVAMDSSGDFMVAWTSFEQDGSHYGVYAQRFDAAGVAQGLEFRVNTFTTGGQSSPSVAMDSAGNFVVAWASVGQDGSSYGTYAQRYDAAGAAQGTEFKVNTFTQNDQSEPAVAMDPAGNFVVTWQSTQDGSFYGVYGQRYSAAGAAQGPEFRVNTYTTGDQFGVAVAMDPSGDFVVAWESANQDGSNRGVYAKRYNAAGVVQGGEFQVNTYTTGSQYTPAVVMGPSGDFVVLWSSGGQDGSTYGIYAQRYDAAGAVQGLEFKVNTFTTSLQHFSAVAMDPAGNFVVAWHSNTQDGSSYGIYAQRYGTRLTPQVLVLQDNPDPVISGNSASLGASGVSSTDGVVTSVSFYRESNGEPGLQVGVFGDTLVGTDTAVDGGVWSINISTTGLTPGNYTYWAQATDDAGLIGAPASTTNTIDPSPGPLVTLAEFQYETSPQKLKFTFDRNVSTTFGLNDIALEKIGGGIVPALISLLPGPVGTNFFTVSMGSLLADGNYRLTLLGTAAGAGGGIRDPISNTPMAGNYVFDFFILAGDADHNRVVDVRDLYILSQHWLGTGKTFSQGDFNYDSLVNKTDLTILAQAWQQALPEPAPPLPAATAARRAPSRTPTRVIDLVS